MALAIECTDCRKRYAVDEGSAGKRVKCRNCGNVFTAEPVARPVTHAAKAAPPAAGHAARPATTRPRPAAVGAAVTAPPPLAQTPLAPPRPPPPPLADEPPDFDALLALSAAEQSAPPADVPPPLPAPLPPPPPMPQSYTPYAPYTPPAPPAPIAPTLPLGYMPRPRRPRANSAVGMDNVTPYFILLFIGAKIFDVIHGMIVLRGFVGPGPLITVAFVDVVVFFAVVATMVWLATLITSKIMKFELPDSAYMKAAGVAAIPSVVVTLIMILPPNRVLAAFLILAIIPVTLWVLKFAFDMTWPEALIALGFTLPLYFIGQVIRVFALGAVMMGFGASQTSFFGNNSGHRHTSINSDNSDDSDGATDTPRGSRRSWQSNPTPAVPERDVLADRVTSLQRRVDDLANRRTEHVSREQMLLQEKQLRAEVEAQRVALGSTPGYEALAPALDAARQKFTALPSEQPDPAVFRDPMPTVTWNDAATAAEGTLGPEVSFKEFKLRPPAEARLDLRGSENDPNGLTWKDPKSWNNSITLTVVPRQNPEQKQPWVLTESFMTRARDLKRLFAVEATDGAPAPVVVGKANNLVFTRIEPDPQAQHAFDRSLKYVALDGNRWLVVTIKADKDNGRMKEAFELAAHSIRKAAGEPRSDPFAPAAMVARLADDSTGASAVLRRQMPAAEDALVAGLAGGDARGDARVRRECALVLRDLGTAKSVPALRQAVTSSEREVAEAARAALRRLAPKEFDAVAEALLDLKATAPWDKKKALAALAAAKPDARRAEVAAVLEDMLVNDKSTFVEKEVADALSVWYGPNTVTRVLPMLSKEGHVWGARREAAMKVLGATKDKRAVPAIMEWLVEDSDHAVAALIAIGPAAEDELVLRKAMWHKIGKVRQSTAQVLEQIGTAKSLDGLRRGAGDQRDPAAAAAAKQALDAVTARIAASKATTKPG